MYYTGYPIFIVAVHMLSGMLVVGISIWLVANGFGKLSRGEGGLWRIAVGFALLLVFAVSLAATLWYYRDGSRPEIYDEATRRQIPVATPSPPDSVSREIVEDYSAVNFEWRDDPSRQQLSLPQQLVPGALPDFTAFFMPFVREHPELERELMAVADTNFFMAFNHFQRDIVKAVDSRSEADLDALAAPSALTIRHDGAARSGLFDAPYLFCSLERAPGEMPLVLLRPAFSEERRLFRKAIPSYSNNVERIFICGVLSRTDGPETEFPVIYDGGAFRFLAPHLWHYGPTQIKGLGGEERLSAIPRITDAYSSMETESLAPILLEATRTGKWNDAIPVFCDEGEDRLRGEIQKDVAILSKQFGSKLKRIRFRPAYGRDIDFIRMAVPSGKKQSRIGLAPEPASPLQPPGIWLVAEAVVELDGLEMPVATWYAVETDDGVCGLASSAFPHDEEPQPENMEDVRESILGLPGSESRRLVSDGRIRIIENVLNKLPAGPAGKPVLSIYFVFTQTEMRRAE
jgi:hypothetical protein